MKKITQEYKEFKLIKDRTVFYLKLLTPKINELNKANEKKLKTIDELNSHILELEESLGEQEEEHQQMVAKLAQSLDSLANRKVRHSKKKINNSNQGELDSLERNLESTHIL